MDLSPGKVTVPCRDLAGKTFIPFILRFIATLCLDSKCPKPITYKAYIVSETREIKLPSRIESVEEAASIAEEFACERGCDDEYIYAIDMAVRESVANAVKHGNKFDSGKLIRVAMEVSRDEARFTIEDQGDGFDVNNIPDPLDPENLFKTSGRGVLFIYNIMDEVTYNDRGNRLTMVKKAPVDKNQEA